MCANENVRKKSGAFGEILARKSRGLGASFRQAARVGVCWETALMVNSPTFEMHLFAAKLNE